MNKIETMTSKDLVLYDPEKGLMSIAVSEAAEKHYTRAKNPEKLFTAIKTKLNEQRKFVLWWDGQDKATGGQPYQSTRRSTTTGSVAGKNGLPDRDTIHRWRIKLKDTITFEISLQDAQKRALRVCEMQKANTIRGTEGTGEFERYTPKEYIDAARKVMGAIDLDPASCAKAQKTVKATKYFTAEADGLAQDWVGRIFLNPPYHRDLAPRFIEKLVQQLDLGNVKQAVLLTNNCTDTEWFLTAQRVAKAICFTHGRINFIDEHGQEVLPTQGQAFFYYGDKGKKFADVFSKFGFGVTPKWDLQE